MDGNDTAISTNGASKSTEPRAREITVLRAGQRTFESSGYTYIKVTHGGTSELLKLPIRSTGVTDVLQRLRDQEPKPPSVQEIVFGDTPAGNELGLRRGEKKVAVMPNLNDPTYKKALEQHREDIVMEVLNQGLVMRFEDSDGKEVTDPKQKLEELKSQGITGEHYRQMTEDIRMLTTLTERDRENFSVPASASAPIPTAD